MDELGVELTEDEKKTMSEVVVLAQRIYVRAVVNTGDVSGVTTARTTALAGMSIEATRMMHRREASLAFEAASSFFHAQAEWMVSVAHAQRASLAQQAAKLAAERAQLAADKATAAAAAAASAAAVAERAKDPASAPERASLVLAKDEVLR